VKKSRFIDSQIMTALKRVGSGLPVPESCRELGFSTATLYKWRSKFGGLRKQGHHPEEAANWQQKLLRLPRQVVSGSWTRAALRGE
jgi:transposase-like protein